MVKGSKTPEETKCKMRESQKRRWDRNREALLQACCYGPHLGAKRSKETRAKMSATHKALYAKKPTASSQL